ncbi:hypothetical protein TEQG_05950 [Trichophyton equinum CBS 127.97]|uniref:Uncharacterized protein n=1 Tax=Trichophyton equinum (strain ATCC MYA-4606 / CBS 127.97) TaxID=559882 RepID=F2PYC9_TRIEC|nr:hypothetical protein TEQG_05950 [Trichophyton equinum CBS 127.97]
MASEKPSIWTILQTGAAWLQALWPILIVAVPYMYRQFTNPKPIGTGGNHLAIQEDGLVLSNRETDPNSSLSGSVRELAKSIDKLTGCVEKQTKMMNQREGSGVDTRERKASPISPP